jgi:uncharacterized cupin superfamily protein
MNAQTATAAAQTVRSFVDLRAFAAGVQIADAPQDFLAARRALPLPSGPVTVEALSLALGGGRVAAIPADEFLFVLDGSISLATQTTRVTLAAGQSAVLPAGLDVIWTVSSYCRAVVMRCTSGPAGADDIVPIDLGAALEPSNPPLAELLLTPTPSCRNHTDYRSANGEFMCGTWDSTPYHRRSMRFRHYELMYLLAGSVTFEDGTGRRATFAAGDVMMVEQGADCSWLSETQVKKVYAIYRPA